MIPHCFSFIQNKNINNHLIITYEKISNWACQWKISFNPDLLKQAQEVIFLHKLAKTNHPILIFNNSRVHLLALQKHFEMFLDCKLNFEEQLKPMFDKINKTIDLLRKFQDFLPRKSLFTIYKSLIRPNLDSCDIIYNQNYNVYFHQRLK